MNKELWNHISKYKHSGAKQDDSSQVLVQR